MPDNKLALWHDCFEQLMRNAKKWPDYIANLFLMRASVEKESKDKFHSEHEEKLLFKYFMLNHQVIVKSVKSADDILFFI